MKTESSMRLSKQERYRLMKISLLDSSIVLFLCFVFDFLFYKFGYHYFKLSITDLYLANTSIVVVLVGLLAFRSWKTIESLWDKQKRLIESERRYRGVVESQQDLVVRVNSEGKLTFVNEAYCRVFGKTSDEFLTQTFHPMVHEDDLPQTLAEMEKLNMPPYRCAVEQRAKTSHGWRWFAWEDSAIHDENGNLIEIQAVGRDITQRKEMEESLREKDQFFSSIFESIQDGISILDTEYSIVKANSVFLQRYALHHDTVIGKKCYSVHHGRDSVCPWCPIPSMIKQNAPSFALIPTDGRDPSQGWSELSTFPLFNIKTGEMEGVIEYIRDVTEKKKAEENLRASEATNRALLKAIPDIIFRISRDGRCIGTVEEEHEDFYKQPSDFLGKHFNEILPSPLAQTWIERVNTVFETGEMQIFEYPLTIKGNEQFFEARMVLSGKDEMLAIIRNITAARRAQEQISTLNAKLEQRVSKRERELAAANKQLAISNQTLNAERTYISTAIDILPIPIFFISGDGKIVRTNSAMSAVMGRLGITSIFDVRVLDPTTHKTIAQSDWPIYAVLNGEVINGEEKILVLPDDTEIPIILHAAPFLINGDIAAIIAIQDISALKESERAKDQFLAILSHELLTPLTSILGWSQLAQGTDRADLTEQSLAVIERNARRQKRLVDDLLDITRIIHRKLSLQLETCELWNLVEQAVESIQQVAEDDHITLQLLPCDKAVTVRVDPERMLQVISNLLNNAMKFTEPGGTITVTEQSTVECARLIIQDNGIGIPSHVLSKLFQPFVQGDHDNRSGLGLGLALVKGIIDEHQGSVTAQSEGLGHGSTFVVELPIML
ncbi:MAG TPA: PAS domain-containing protein [Armatimonadota bacterium]|nr:PAS domain-containing protein [Armatimonadota bacterium]